MVALAGAAAVITMVLRLCLALFFLLLPSWLWAVASCGVLANGEAIGKQVE
jgi:hypothetical protein